MDTMALKTKWDSIVQETCNNVIKYQKSRLCQNLLSD